MIICAVAQIIAVSTLNTAARCKSHVAQRFFLLINGLYSFEYRCCNDADAGLVLFGSYRCSVMGRWVAIAAFNQTSLRHCAD